MYNERDITVNYGLWGATWHISRRLPTPPCQHANTEGQVSKFNSEGVRLMVPLQKKAQGASTGNINIHFIFDFSGGSTFKSKCTVLAQ